MSTRRAQVIAFYLPQYHPIPENDDWWGAGFTEWTDVARARPLFPGHRQPQLPGELGFYDLRLAETRAAQADLARAHGVAAFCYWHYWFEGRQLMERPFNEVLHSGAPDFPFCLGWANHHWLKKWRTGEAITLRKQTYGGMEDHRRHFATLLPAFRDPRYFTVDGKPLVYIAKPAKIPDMHHVTDLWRECARRAGLPGLYLVGLELPPARVADWGFDAARVDAFARYDDLARIARRRLPGSIARVLCGKRLHRLLRRPVLLPYAWMAAAQAAGPFPPRVHPTLVPNWDNTPRAAHRGWILTGATPARFAAHVRAMCDAVGQQPAAQRLLFLRSWNEWSEGNYVEPDRQHGRSWLEALRSEVCAPDGAPSR